MKAALIGDVHANLPALEAVLAHARKQNVEAIWNIGDFVGYGPFPDQVVRLLRQTGAASIIGNYDLKVLKAPRKKEEWKANKPPEKWTSFQWAYDHLSQDSRDYLASLPPEVRMEVYGRHVLLCHGSPDSMDEHLYPQTPQERLEELARSCGAEVVVCGHSHMAFVRQAGKTVFINTGSVGRSDDGDPRACYGVLEITPQRADAKHHRVEYDVKRVVEEIHNQHLPEDFAQMAILGRSLDFIRTQAQGAAGGAQGKTDEEKAIQSATRLAEDCNYEAGHTRQVTKLALRLFDELASLHQLGPAERLWLHCAGLLHDIGWQEGRQGHHKTSQRIILDSPLRGLDGRVKRIVACVARYHRKALPRPDHEPFGSLAPADQHVVEVLSALLRVADGLDCDHLSAVKDVQCRLLPKRVIIRCLARFRVEAERQNALEKGDLFNHVFRRQLVIEWRLV